LIPSDPGDSTLPAMPPDPAGPVDPVDPGKAPARPGASTFTIEGRQAPALFVVGWLATIVGLGAVLVAVLAGASAASPILLVAGLVILSIGLMAGAGSQGLERRARAATVYTGPSPLLVFAASVPASLAAVIVLSVPMGLLGIDVRGPVGALVSVATQALVYAALLRLLVVDVGALTWAGMGLRRPDRSALVEFAGGAMWAVPVIFLTIPVAAILGAIFPVTPVSPLPASGTTIGLAVNLLAGAVIAPIGEELLFRGFATTAWAQDLGPRRALIRGALFFAVVHILNISAGTAGDALGLILIGFASRVPVALVLGWLFLKRRSIWAPLGLHATFNAILIVLSEVALRNGI